MFYILKFIYFIVYDYRVICIIIFNVKWVCVMGELGFLIMGNFSIGMCFGESYCKYFVIIVCNVDF